MLPIEIFLIDDDEDDVFLMKQSLKKSKVHVNINSVGDGAEALKYLRQLDQYSKALTPDLILLDLNMPKVNGSQVLEAIKQDPKLKRIPVVILTTSNAPSDIQMLYDLGANCYVTKPVNFDHFQALISKISEFWFTIVKLPKGRPDA